MLDLRYVDYDPEMSRNWKLNTEYEAFLIVAEYMASDISDGEMDFDDPVVIEAIDAIHKKDLNRIIDVYNKNGMTYFEVYPIIEEIKSNEDPYISILDLIEKGRKKWEKYKKEE